VAECHGRVEMKTIGQSDIGKQSGMGWPLALEAGRVPLNQRNWVAECHGRVEMDTIRQSDIVWHLADGIFI
jgi:hypothetical protein